MGSRGGLLLWYKGRQKVLAENQNVLLSGWKDGSYSVWGKAGSRQLPTFSPSTNKTSCNVVCDVSMSLL